jgi:hypothetical protein
MIYFLMRMTGIYIIGPRKNTHRLLVKLLRALALDEKELLSIHKGKIWAPQLLKAQTQENRLALS